MKALKFKDMVAWVLAFFFIYLILGIGISAGIKNSLGITDFGTLTAINALVAAVGSTLFILKFGSWKTKKEIETK